MKASLLLSLAGVGSLLAVTITDANAQNYLPVNSSAPSYSGLVVGYTQANFDDYSENSSDINFRFEQRLHDNLYISALYHDFSESYNGSPFPVELEDMQVGIGYFERSEVGPYVDVSVLVGRETFQRAATGDTSVLIHDESTYFGLQLGLREQVGMLEAQAGLAYVAHEGQRSDQLRWHAGAFLTIWQNLAVGLRYQDNDDYNLRSIEFRFSW